MKLLRKITDKKILFIFTFIILFFLPILKQGSFYLVKFNIITNYDSINPAYVFYFCIPFYIYVYIKNLIKTKRDFDIYDYIFYALVLAGIIASILALDSDLSWWGKDFRHEGFFTVLCYYLLFINWKLEGTKKDINRIINMFIVIAVINSIYALLQIYTKWGFILRYTPDTQMASGICGNPNFFGSLIVTVLGIVTTKFLINKKISIKNLLLVVLLFVALISAQSTGPFITYIITMIFLVIYLLIKKKIFVKNIICLFIILIVTYLSILFINKEMFNITRCEMCDFFGIVNNRNVSINNETSTESTINTINTINTISNGRTEIWKNSLNIAKKNLINGVGYDNFYLAYYEGVNLTEVTFVSMDGRVQTVRKYWEIVDNAHNVYLHTLVSSGLLGLIPYLLLCLLTFIRGLRTKENLIILLLGGFVAYSVQAFANINVLQVAPIYYIIIGLILCEKQ